MNKQDVIAYIKDQHQFKELGYRVKLCNDYIRGQQLQKQQLEQEIITLKIKMDGYNYQNLLINFVIMFL